MLRLALKNAVANRSRFALTTLAVVLSVAFLTATLILTDSARGTAAEDIAAANASVDAVVAGEQLGEGDGGGPGELTVRQLLPAGTEAVIDSVDGVGETAPVISGFAKLVNEGEALGGSNLADVGQNWIPSPLNPFEIDEGTPPSQSDQVVIDRRVATEEGLAVGDHVQVLTSTGVHDVTITGLATFGGADTAPTQRTTLFDESITAEILGQAGPSQVLVDFIDPAVADDTVADLSAAVPDAVVTSGADYIDAEQAAATSPITFLTIFLLSFAGLATAVGITIIYNTFAIAFAQRRRELALLRAVGAERRQVMRSIMTEAALIGLGATAIGLALGYWGVGVLRWVMEAIGLEFLSGPTVVSFTSLLIATSTGLFVTLVSAWFPARRATSVAPVEALRESTTESSNASIIRAIVGVASLLVGSIALVAAAVLDNALVLAGAILLVPGLVLAGPMLVHGSVQLARPLLNRVAGVEGSMAATNLERNGRRASSTSLALALGIAMIGFFTLLANSLSASLTGNLDAAIEGNYVITSVTTEAATIDPALEAQLTAIDGVVAVGAVAQIDGRADGEEATIAGIDVDQFTRVFSLGVTDGSLDELAQGGVAVLAGDSSTAPTIGQELTLELAEGTLTAPVVAILADSLGGFDQPTHFIDATVLADTQSGSLDQIIDLDADPDAIDEIRTLVADTPGSLLETRDSYLAAAGTEIDAIRNLVYAMLGLTVFIALVGITNTTMLAINERTREIGLLRAIGATRTGVRRIVRLEAALLAAVGTAVGVVIALFGGWALLATVQGAPALAVPWLSLWIITIGGIVAGTAAAAYPSWRASRRPTLEAIAVTT